VVPAEVRHATFSLTSYYDVPLASCLCYGLFPTTIRHGLVPDALLFVPRYSLGTLRRETVRLLQPPSYFTGVGSAFVLQCRGGARLRDTAIPRYRDTAQVYSDQKFAHL
jgi:hypothetical protein